MICPKNKEFFFVSKKITPSDLSYTQKNADLGLSSKNHIYFWGVRVTGSVNFGAKILKNEKN